MCSLKYFWLPSLHLIGTFDTTLSSLTKNRVSESCSIITNYHQDIHLSTSPAKMLVAQSETFVILKLAAFIHCEILVQKMESSCFQILLFRKFFCVSLGFKYGPFQTISFTAKYVFFINIGPAYCLHDFSFQFICLSEAYDYQKLCFLLVYECVLHQLVFGFLESFVSTGNTLI